MATTKVSQQESIRKLFTEKKLTRGEIAKKLGIRYQIVFKATNVRYAPKSWSERLEQRHLEVKASKEETPEA